MMTSFMNLIAAMPQGFQLFYRRNAAGRWGKVFFRYYVWSGLRAFPGPGARYYLFGSGRPFRALTWAHAQVGLRRSWPYWTTPSVPGEFWLRPALRALTWAHAQVSLRRNWPYWTTPSVPSEFWLRPA